MRVPVRVGSIARIASTRLNPTTIPRPFAAPRLEPGGREALPIARRYCAGCRPGAVAIENASRFTANPPSISSGGGPHEVRWRGVFSPQNALHQPSAGPSVGSIVPPARSGIDRAIPPTLLQKQGGNLAISAAMADRTARARRPRPALAVFSVLAEAPGAAQILDRHFESGDRSSIASNLPATSWRGSMDLGSRRASCARSDRPSRAASSSSARRRSGPSPRPRDNPGRHLVRRSVHPG